MDVTEVLVEDALNQLWNFSRLGSHPLVDALLKPSNESRSRLGLIARGAALNQHIVGAIEQIKVSREDARKSRERRYYDILSRRYVDRRTNREVAHALSVSERTFYRERSKAIEALTRVLADDAHGLE